MRGLVLITLLFITCAIQSQDIILSTWTKYDREQVLSAEIAEVELDTVPMLVEIYLDEKRIEFEERQTGHKWTEELSRIYVPHSYNYMILYSKHDGDFLYKLQLSGSYQFLVMEQSSSSEVFELISIQIWDGYEYQSTNCTPQIERRVRNAKGNRD